MKLTVFEFVSVDGVSQGPGSPEEDTSDGFTQGGWLVPFIDGAFIRQAAAWLGQADALLLGRRTYDAFARDWPQITDPDDPFTVLMNGLPKYVASHTLTRAAGIRPPSSRATSQRRSQNSNSNPGGSSRSTEAPGWRNRCWPQG